MDPIPGIQAWQESEARLRILLEHAPEAIVVFDADSGRFVSCNENACRLYGLSREALLYLHPWDLSPPTQPDGRPSTEAARDYIQRARDGAAPVFEWVHRHASGRRIPCEVRLVSLPGGDRPMIRGSILDNTERHRRERVQQATYEIADAALAADDLQSFYRRVHEIVKRLMPVENFYLALLEPETGQITFPYYVDQRTPRPPALNIRTGLTGEVLRLCQPLLITRDMEARKRTVGEGVIIEGVADLPYKELGLPAANWLGVPLLHKNMPLGVMAVQDYHNPQAYGEDEKQILVFVAAQVALALERKRAEQAMRESEQKFRVLFEASSQGVMLQDENGFLQVNGAAARIFGLTPEQVVGLHPRDLAPPRQPDGRDSAEAAQRYIVECLRSGTARFEWVSRRANGEDVPLDVVLTNIRMGGREIIQAVVTDISERKRAETELRHALERERELSVLKSNFVSMVSHEFRTPLGVIQSSAEILHDYLDQLEPAERRDQLASITKNTRRMAGLMEEVLVLGRLDAGKLNFQPAPVPLDELCRRIAEEVLSATDQQCPIQFIADDLPKAAGVDERLLSHILTNLLGNAVKYSEPGSPIQFSASCHQDRVTFLIRDQGIGIPEDERARLFTAFQRGSNVGHRPGTGLGLVIVKRCVDLHGGTLTVESQVGKGTTVRVDLPAMENHKF